MARPVTGPSTATIRWLRASSEHFLLEQYAVFTAPFCQLGHRLKTLEKEGHVIDAKILLKIVGLPPTFVS